MMGMREGVCLTCGEIGYIYPSWERRCVVCKMKKKDEIVGYNKSENDNYNDHYRGLSNEDRY